MSRRIACLLAAFIAPSLTAFAQSGLQRSWLVSWWAWTVYFLLALLFASYLYHNWRRRFELRQQMKLQKQLSDFRIQLLSNITHEFLTPLTIINRAVEKLDKKSAAVQTALRSTRRMLKLVNLFMEFRKAQTGNLRLHVTNSDIVSFVRIVCQDFWPMAQQKKIQLSFTPKEKIFTSSFDHDLLEAVLYNLISNAIKYTPEHGSIIVRLRREGSSVVISCEDTGPGISEELQEVIFQPFLNGLTSQDGMGIGLYTSYEIAKAHHGSLTYALSETGGSLFTLTLPTEEAAYRPEDFSTGDNKDAEEEEMDYQSEEVFQEMQFEALNDQHVAVIEENYDMLQQLRMELSTYFHTDCYMNGKAGLEGVVNEPPSLIICDVTMTDMNGYEIVTQLKQNPKTASIPIIMLSAHDDDMYEIQAYKVGADDYIVKPCNFRVLLAKSMQLMKKEAVANQKAAMNQGEARPVHHSRSSDEANKHIPEGVIITSHADKVFIDKLAVFIAQHMNEPDFNMDRLTEMMSMGRTKFYNKVKDITGLSPNKYLMRERMRKAAKLLAEGELNVSEVSYRIGIQDPSYFKKCFKAQYGVVPSKYVQHED